MLALAVIHLDCRDAGTLRRTRLNMRSASPPPPPPCMSGCHRLAASRKACFNSALEQPRATPSTRCGSSARLEQRRNRGRLTAHWQYNGRTVRGCETAPRSIARGRVVRIARPGCHWPQLPTTGTADSSHSRSHRVGSRTERPSVHAVDRRVDVPPSSTVPQCGRPPPPVGGPPPPCARVAARVAAECIQPLRFIPLGPGPAPVHREN